MGNELVANGTGLTRAGFGEQSLEKRGETASTAEAARAQAEVQARCIMAIQRPRDVDNVRVRLLSECGRPSFANRAYFSVQRGNKPGRISGTANRIEGLSVRFAEAAIRHMGNIMVTTRSVYDDAEKRIIAVTVVDLETNAAHGKDVVINKTVERRKLSQGQVAVRTRTNSFGDTVYIVEATDDELLQKENALVSKTLRTEGLRLLSADIIEDCEEQIITTIRRKDAEDPGAARKAIADGFAVLNVLPSDLKAYLGHDLAQCSPAQLTDLRGLYAAIREGETTWMEIMAQKNEAADEPATTFATGTGGDQATADNKPAGRGARAAQRVRAQTQAQTSSASAAQPEQPEQPQGAQKGGTAQQVPLAGGTELPGKTNVDVQPGTVQGVPSAKSEPVIPSSATAASMLSIEEERKIKIAREVELISTLNIKVGEKVIVTLVGGQVVETFAKGFARMFGELAVINVDGIDNPVALHTVSRPTSTGEGT